MEFVFRRDNGENETSNFTVLSTHSLTLVSLTLCHSAPEGLFYVDATLHDKTHQRWKAARDLFLRDQQGLNFRRHRRRQTSQLRGECAQNFKDFSTKLLSCLSCLFCRIFVIRFQRDSLCR
jgi:hypothetical protein